ncbi:MAG: tetratricopeptide repeat protein, partial [Elusimicrobia bacterium]|nr:tetratricopeptide repeat protein [Elusimicrobiota bacterium]
FERLGDPRSARKDLDQAVDAAPDDADVWMARGGYYRRMDDPRRAMADYGKALKVKPDLADAMLARGEILAEAGKDDDARKAFDDALKTDPSLDEAYDRRGRLEAVHQDADPALRDFTKAVELRPGQPDYLLDLGVARLRRHEYWKAIGALDRCLAQGGPAALARGARAEARSALGMTSQAFADVQEALKADPRSSDLYMVSGLVHLNVREYAEALTDLDRAVSLDRKNARAWHLRGLAHGGLGELADAVDDLDRAAGLADRPVSELTDLCHAERLRGRVTRAIDACSKAIELDHDAGRAYVQRGLAFLAGGDFSRAARDLEDGSRLSPPRPQAFLAESIALAALRQYKDSDRAYRRAMAIDPMVKSADLTLGEDPGPSWDYRARIDALAPVIEKDADDPNSFLVLGDALANAGLYDQAILQFTRALEADGRLVAGYLDRGAALAAQDSLDAAEQDLRRAVELAPSDPLAEQSLVTLLTARRKFGEGLTAAIAALKAESDSPDAESFVKAGNLRYFLRQVDRAQENYEYALKFAPDHASAHNGMGLCWFASKSYEKALESFSRAIELLPDHDRFIRNRAAAFVNMGQYENAVYDYKLALTVNRDPAMVPEYQRLIKEAQARVGTQASK